MEPRPGAWKPSLKQVTAWAPTRGLTLASPDALAVVTHRIAHLQQQYRNQLPTTVLHEWDTSLQTKTKLITPKGILTSFPDGIDIVLAILPDIPKNISTHPIIHHHEQTLHHIVRLIHFLHNVQLVRIAYILANTSSDELHPHIQPWLTPNITVDGPPSATYRKTHICQDITPNGSIQEKFSQLPIPTTTISDRLSHANIHH